MLRRTSSLLFIVLVIGLVGCDHATKRLAETELRGHRATPLITNVLELRYTENRDIAFSLLQKVPERVKTPLIFLGGAAGLGFLAYVWSQRRGARWPEHLAYAVILAGALGNLTDRMVRGYVVDFVYLHHWPVFNVADVYLVVGGILLLLASRSAAAPPVVPASAQIPKVPKVDNAEKLTP